MRSLPGIGGAMAKRGVSPATGQDGTMTPLRLQVTVPGTAEAVTQALRDLLPSPIFAAYSPDMAVNAEIVLAEVLNNVVEHAYARHSGDITLVLRGTGRGLACELTDRGAAMPGLTLPVGAFQDLGEVEDLPEGGFGWYLIRTLVEDLRYERRGDENHLSFLLVDEQ